MAVASAAARRSASIPPRAAPVAAGHAGRGPVVSSLTVFTFDDDRRIVAVGGRREQVQQVLALGVTGEGAVEAGWIDQDVPEELGKATGETHRGEHQSGQQRPPPALGPGEVEALEAVDREAGSAARRFGERVDQSPGSVSS